MSPRRARVRGRAQDVLAVWREVHLFHEWVPSCVSSQRLRLHGQVDVLLTMGLNVLGLLSRDAVLHGYGVDCLPHTGQVLMLASSVSAADLPAEAHLIPPAPAWPLVRMEYRRLQVRRPPSRRRALPPPPRPPPLPRRA